jgi:DNA-binding transcriptional LysR family regulator
MPWDHRIKRRLKLRDLDTLMAVAGSGSMAKAAAQLSISQPAISKAIADMERTLGVQLFDRTAQGVEPTLYGRALLKWSTAIFDDLRQGIGEIDFLSDPGAGEVRIGASEPMLGGFVPKVIDRLVRQYPRISIQVSPVSQWTAQLRALRERSIDLQVGRLPQSLAEDDLRTEVLFNERACIVAAPQHPMARRRRLTLVDLMDQQWSLPPTAMNVAGQMIADLFRSHGLDLPKNLIITPAIQVHCGLLATGRYLAIFPGSLLQFGLQHMPLKVLPVRLQIEAPPVGITVLKNRTLNPVTQLFIECAREVAKLVK